MFCFRSVSIFCASWLVLATAPAQVAINEVSSASNERMLQWTASGEPRLGCGPHWQGAAFVDTTWTSGSLPAGWGYSVVTNLQSAMQNKTPSLYLRKVFNVTPGQASITLPLVLQVDADDGFVAYINGVEVARSNCGPAKHFLYASQPAYNANTGFGFGEYQLAAANTLLVPGSNILAIQAHNSSLSSNFKINAGLKVLTATGNISVTKALYDFNAASNASRTHTNTNGTVTNTAQGTPVAGGWLATAADPASDNTWTSLQVVTSEVAGGGVGGSGGLRYTITQSGTNRGLSLRAPAVSMANAWTGGAIPPTALASTSLSFRYRVTGDLQFGLRMDPALNQSANSTDGYPVLGQPLGGAADYDWNAALGGAVIRTITSTGSASSSPSGSINLANYETFSGPNCRDGQFTVKEDNGAGLGPGGSTGVMSLTWNAFPTNVDSLGVKVNNLTVTEWTAGAITAADFERTRISFRWKLPAGRQMNFSLESSIGASAADIVPFGTFFGTGNWEAYSATLSTLPNSAALRTKLNLFNSKTPKFTLAWNGNNFLSGEQVFLDTLNLYYEQAGATLEEELPLSVSLAAGASRTLTVDAAGAQTPSLTGTPTTTFSLFADPAIRGFAAAVVEDATAGGGNGGAAGYLKCSVTDAADTPAPWGFSVSGMRVRNWTAGNITPLALADATLQLAVKIPSGISVQLAVEPTGGSTANRATLAALTGTGTWQIISREFATAGNVENFRAALNAANTTSFQITFTGPSNASLGEVISVDDVVVVPWRTYQTLLSAGANRQRFLDFLNQNFLTSFIPTFVKNTGAPPGGATFSVDDFQVIYTGPDPSAAQQLINVGAAGGTWKYFVGLAEPSGGLFDPSLITNGFPAPPGEEDDYENPQNFRDWVELKNNSPVPVNLTNWSLSDDPDLPAKWKFPATGSTIPANGYLLVMCDNRNEANGSSTYLHANFELSATGESVRLYDAGGALISAVTSVPDQDSWHTWAANPTGGDFGFTDAQTPGAANAGAFSSGRVKPPDFLATNGQKLSGGFYTGSQVLVLSTETVGAQIRYTLDGSEPTEANGLTYATPLTLTAPNNKTGVVVRARALLAGQLPSSTKTHTYLIDQHANLRVQPALMFSGDAGRNFYLPQGVMAINGGTYNGELWAATDANSYNIPQGRGDAFERQISAEWQYPDGRDGWREEVGVRISSSPYSRPRLLLTQTGLSPWTSDHRHKPSFNLYWRDDYGNSKLRHASIPDNDVREYKHLRIRAGKNDILNPFIIDELSRRTYRNMGWVQPTGTLVSLYVNGSFKGIFNPTERLREPLFQEHYHTDNQFDVRYIGEQVDGDVTFWNQMEAALNTLQTTPTLANYNNVKNYLDVENVADYFLFAIYINYDDWPENNWAAQRERTTAGRYRMVAWDAEGAWSRFGKAVNYDTINGKLLAASGPCGSIFKRLYASPEFKLLFADRIARHMFNNGVLDDRAANAPIRKLKDSLVAQAQPLVGLVQAPNNPASVTIDVAWFNNHLNAATGRRAYLFGSAATTGTFRNKSLWPTTEPPTFSQFGGITAASYPLAITHSAPVGSTIYYTLDGTDPRNAGGTVAATALAYSAPVILNALGTVKARVLNATGEWSPLTEAFFQPGAVAASTTNLTVTEINYHAPDPTAAEVAAGFTDAGDFEFIRLSNLGSVPIDLRQLQFTAGVTFNFATGDVLAVAPGASILVVKRRTAFEKRYGLDYGSQIAGEFTGSLDNSGEPLKLEWGTTAPLAVVQSFSYNDKAPWPVAADGYGPTLILNDRTPGADLSDGTKWIASAQPGGMPGGAARVMNYSTWRSLTFSQADAANNAISGPTADPDQDGCRNLDEYALGLTPGLVDAGFPQPALLEVAGQKYQSLEYRVMANATDSVVTPQVSSDLSAWQSGAGQVVTVSGPIQRLDGSVAWLIRDATAQSAAQRRFIRLFITGP